MGTRVSPWCTHDTVVDDKRRHSASQCLTRAATLPLAVRTKSRIPRQPSSPGGLRHFQWGSQHQPPPGRKEDLSGYEPLYTDLHSQHNVNLTMQHHFETLVFSTGPPSSDLGQKSIFKGEKVLVTKFCFGQWSFYFVFLGRLSIFWPVFLRVLYAASL